MRRILLVFIVSTVGINYSQANLFKWLQNGGKSLTHLKQTKKLDFDELSTLATPHSIDAFEPAVGTFYKGMSQAIKQFSELGTVKVIPLPVVRDSENLLSVIHLKVEHRGLMEADNSNFMAMDLFDEEYIFLFSETSILKEAADIERFFTDNPENLQIFTRRKSRAENAAIADNLEIIQNARNLCYSMCTRMVRGGENTEFPVSGMVNNFIHSSQEIGIEIQGGIARIGNRAIDQVLENTNSPSLSSGIVLSQIDNLLMKQKVIESFIDLAKAINREL